ncbi:cell division protein ZapE [Antrihabitans cavernicola]|uniref:Cell division protein ZapE n=1 Tax=Antrihabitans cavernicola TaxID=2495913 RepID=A0A5A7S763_9NOCA|nr:cell division protein ZapE [Spelaeibacter cavernicola]KAA0021998.1 cell division protein ZapE [Spelaeibacter cavernicola]
MTLIEQIEQRARDDGFELDDVQRRAAAGLAALNRDRRPHRGLYLWGPVGRGKTWLLDAFVAFTPIRETRRMHWHSFLVDLHRVTHALGSIDAAVDALLRDCQMLSFDEFHVHNIGDAKLVERFLNAVFARGIVFVVTSNYPPAGLMPNPLTHHAFLSAIALIESRMKVLAVAGPVDYRTVSTAARQGFSDGNYFVGAMLDDGPTIELQVGTRFVCARQVDGDSVRFDFRDLCERPTATADYLILVERYRRWTISAVPPLVTATKEAVARFCNVVDVLCDAGVELTVVSDVPLDRLVDGDISARDLARTVSRLSMLHQEMATNPQPGPSGWMRS